MLRRTFVGLRVEDCPFRRPDGAEHGQCSLLCELLGVSNSAASQVARDVCESCCRSDPPSIGEPNPIIASLLFSRATRLASSLGSGAEADRLRAVAEKARNALDFVLAESPSNVNGESSPHRPLVDLIPAPGSRHGGVSDWAVGVTTCPRIQPTLERCLASLARAGWSAPRLFLDAAVRVPESFGGLPFTHRDTKVGAFPNYILSLSELLLRHPRADAYMMVQDDAFFFDREPLTTYLESVLWPGETPGLVSLYCADPDTGPEPGWHVCDSKMWGGPVALIFPRELAKAFVTDRLVFEHRWNACDDQGTLMGDVISSWAGRTGAPIWLPTPSLVQHVGAVSTLWPLARAAGSRRAGRFVGDER